MVKRSLQAANNAARRIDARQILQVPKLEPDVRVGWFVGIAPLIASHLYEFRMTTSFIL